MKKLFVTLLLVCMICSCCIAFTACDKSDTGIYEPDTKCELIKNSYYGFNFSWFNQPFYFECNTYMFKVWYSYSHFEQGINFPVVKCSSPYLVDFAGHIPGFQYPLQVSNSTDESNANVYCEYLTNYSSNKYSVKPNSWIYFSLQFIIPQGESASVTIELSQSNKDDEPSFATYTIDLTGTYKYA